MTHPRLYVRATELIGFEELVAGGAYSATALLEMAGIDPSKLRQPDSLMPFRNFAHLIEITADKLNRPSFGLEYSLAGPDHAPALGPLILFSRLATNAQDCINLALQYWKYHTNAYAIQQLHDPDLNLAVFRFVLNSDAPATRQYVEAAFSNIVRVCRIATGYHDVNPSVVRFQHSRPNDTTLHQHVFRCPIEFEAEHSEILFDPTFLQHQLDGGLSFIKPIVGLFIRHRIKCLPIYDQTMARTVALAIPSVLGVGKCNIDFIATSIGLSAKKLRRLLAAENTTFSDVLDDVRANLAREYLVETDAPVASIARLLDYASAPPFILAFKRWNGETPTEFRHSRRLSEQRADHRDV
jgi:AraC-like DNA-binding protein